VSKITGGLAALLILFSWTGFAVAAKCSISTTPVNFGSYDVLSASSTDSSGAISVYCNSATYVTGSIGPSFNSGGFDPRQMRLTTGSELMDYNLYTDVVRTQIWGDGTGDTLTVSGTVPNKVTTNFTIYGRIPAGQDILAGLYTETLTVTISW
jgi:spore coat protein U-like protein